MSLEDFFTQHRVPWEPAGHHHVRSGWIGVDCPQCSPNSSRWRLGFEIGSRRCHCWVCGRLNPIKMIMLLCRVNAEQAKQAIGRYRAPPLAQTDVIGTLVPPAGVCAMQTPHKNYLRRRGFDADQIASVWNVQGIGPASKLKWRLYIPIHNRFGRQVSWTTRSINDKAENRYWSASPEQEEIPHKSILYGAHLALHTIIICEGPTDAWAIGPGAVATCGVGYSQRQLIEMSNYPVRVVCFDNTKEAQKRADELCKALCVFPGVTERVVLETGDDPASADPDEVEELKQSYLKNFTVGIDL